jgi:four helix bundle protein
LRVWQDAVKVAAQIYRATQMFPRQEMYGIVAQLRSAAVSVPSNIAEGKGRSGDKEFIHFLHNARGSILEIQTQLIISRELKFLGTETAEQLLRETDELAKGVNALINSLRLRAA